MIFYNFIKWIACQKIDYVDFDNLTFHNGIECLRLEGELDYICKNFDGLNNTTTLHRFFLN